MHSSGKTGPRPVVLLVHGILSEGRTWIVNPPNSSLGFALADAGCDVWLINTRGTSWSRRHKTLSIDQEEFWNFSFHEIAIYDIPATINFILHKTKEEGLYYIGQSQGGTLGLVAFSLRPQVAQKVKLFMALAPTYTFVGTSGPAAIFFNLPDGLIRLIWGTKEFVGFSNKRKRLNAKLCSYPVIDQICIQIIFLNSGCNPNNLNVSRVDVYTGILPDFASVKNMIHLAQVFKSKELKYFDYGSKNKAIYNTTTPPFYQIEDMVVPTAVWYGGHDIMSNRKDIQLLLPRISNLVFHKYIPEWQHADFLWGLDAPKKLYPDIFHLILKYK
ncbi:lysosomal acid lipase/cholesteryl ester hydrolase-like [Lacerta agilis]|uniref:lysosomal acid lipase/cholesteryl ester hydrolase-like n=1 Tax=Lacerta agilis TaxID=80427 RepID=UPI00141996D2|nr:lysosomal acid lipase/cholesteryl ester hydrolase-like [Lacerta agilis]